MTIISLAILTLLAAVGIIQLWRAKAHDARENARLRDNFYKASEKLADTDSDRVPTTVIAYLLFFSMLITRRDVLPRLVWHIIRGRFDERPLSPNNRIMQDLRTLDRQLSDAYALAVLTFVLALSYNHVILGRITRRFLFWGIDPNQKSHRALMAAADLTRGKGLASVKGAPDGDKLFGILDHAA